MDAATAWDRLRSVRTEADAATVGLLRTRTGWTWSDTATDEAVLLAELYAPLCLAAPTQVVAQLGQSLDGFIGTRTGDANFVTGEEDRRHLHRVRALVDAVVVGAGTAVADDPRLTVRAVPGPNPVRVVLDPRGRVSPALGLFTDGAADTLWLVGEAATVPGPCAPHVELVWLPVTGAASAGRFDPRQVLVALRERGLGRVLVEGGGVTVSAFLQADLVDRLYLTVAPVLIGDGVPGLRFPGTAVMADALRPPTRTFALGADVLFELDVHRRDA